MEPHTAALEVVASHFKDAYAVQGMKELRREKAAVAGRSRGTGIPRPAGAGHTFHP